MHCLGLIFTNVDVEHLFQKVAYLHDLRSNATDFTWLYSEHLAKFQRGKCAERKIPLSIPTILSYVPQFGT